MATASCSYWRMISNLPTVQELLDRTGDMGSIVTQPDDRYTSVFLRLDIHHKTIEILATYALLIWTGLDKFEHRLDEQDLALQGTDIAKLNLENSVQKLREKGVNNYQGWVGEIITDFVLRHFMLSHLELLGYEWCAFDPPKGDVNDHSLDIVAAYSVQNNQLGHLCGEIKTYENLQQGKSQAYNKLIEAYNNSRDEEIRRSLNSLFRAHSRWNPVTAAIAAMGKERSFLPSILHNSKSRYKTKDTFSDMPDKFKECMRASQKIGIQISIVIDGKEKFEHFFEEFLKQMQGIASRWVRDSITVETNV